MSTKPDTTMVCNTQSCAILMSNLIWTDLLWEGWMTWLSDTSGNILVYVDGRPTELTYGGVTYVRGEVTDCSNVGGGGCNYKVYKKG